MAGNSDCEFDHRRKPWRDRHKRLTICWAPSENCFAWFYPNLRGSYLADKILHVLKSPEANAVANWRDELPKSLFDEIEARGYDLKTLVITVDKKKEPNGDSAGP